MAANVLNVVNQAGTSIGQASASIGQVSTSLTGISNQVKQAFQPIKNIYRTHFPKFESTGRPSNGIVRNVAPAVGGNSKLNWIAIVLCLLILVLFVYFYTDIGKPSSPKTERFGCF